MPRWLKIETEESAADGRRDDAAAGAGSGRKRPFEPAEATSATTVRVPAVVGWLVGFAVVLGVVGAGVLLGRATAGQDTEGATAPGVAGAALATVNGEPIRPTDVDVELVIQSELRRRLTGQELSGEAAIQAFRRELVDRLVDRWLVLQDAQALGLSVTDAELAAGLPGLGSKFGLGTDELRQAVLASPYSLGEGDWVTWGRQQILLAEYLNSDRARQLSEQHMLTIGRCQEPLQCAAGVLFPQSTVRFAVDGQMVAPAREGQPAPDFELPAPDGTPIRLSQYIGKPIMVNFWATWCAPCRIEMPLFINAYETNRDDLVILAVDSQETPEQVTAYAQNIGMTMPIVIDDGKASTIYRVKALPTTFFIDREGIIVRAHRGAIRARPELKPMIEEIFPEVQLGAALRDLRPRALLAALR